MRGGWLWLVAAPALACAAPVRGGFDGVLDGLESRYGVHHTAPPFFGLVRAALWLGAPAGASDLRLAMFEDQSFGDPTEIADLVRRRAGAGFQPLVQTSSRKSGETTLILAHPDGDDRIALLIFTRERKEATLVQVVVDADQLAETVKAHRNDAP